MSVIQVSLAEALSPEPAKVSPLERTPASEALWEFAEPIKVLSPSTGRLQQPRAKADMALALSSAPRSFTRIPRKVGLPEALGSLSPAFCGGYEFGDDDKRLAGDDRFFMGLPLQSPSPSTPPQVLPVQLSVSIAADSCLEREAMARETVMRLGLATPCKPLASGVAAGHAKVSNLVRSLFDAETTTGVPTPCSSPDRQSTIGSPSCSDQDALGGAALPHTALYPSRGSVLHMTGNCHPCAWFWKPVGCQSATECGFCHLCPDGVLKARKKAKQAMKRLGLNTPKEKRSLKLASLI
mmetsp:Transcript_107612/g.299768  ORF Transcript_107612/g.299768 Transcript_107612/m.299768 type:complete len:296 (-) Transcript_107612:208-1095(-)|eukprot:CAMPEP_0179068886 /NCGR_PEP_ID=MMETSP0796-20121207/30227_1 /TAXON_ID=73915 /ORGANISM="Pyrodinium bahamense, Strain pbaha01" /LENGTH=295 /DNA_ID=CAMNT_0020765943 /DNA_START=79 /DNA_END=966 /DNA_ORIENTATION=+